MLIGTVLVASMISLATGFVLAEYYSIDVFSSLIVFLPDDCYQDWPTRVGRHCFSDYSITANIGTVPNPWDPYPLYLPPDFKPTHFNYTAAGMVPHVAFALVGKWLGMPRFGLFAYLLFLAAAVFSPAVWAARGARGVERIVVFLVCGAAAVPAWVVLDRGNSVGFVVPVALIFLVTLCRQRWGLVTVTVVLAALVKPQFAVLVVVLFAARQWRLGGIAVLGVAISNLAAYLLWPRDFPHTIMQSIGNTVGYSGGSQVATVEGSNASFGKALLAIPDGIKAQLSGGKIPDGFLAETRSLIGYVLLLVVVVLVAALGKRVPPVMAGIVLLATASLFPALSNPYYLVFVLPVAAVVVRDPDGAPGRGIFDRAETVGIGRRVVGVCVSIATALSIAQIPLPTATRRVVQSGTDVVLILVDSTMSLAPSLWLIALVSIFVSYVRRPVTAGSVAERSQPVASRAAEESPATGADHVSVADQDA
ncbi:hypothetical protein C0J29_13195 [Mycobacterium paragordonae]|nr:hypothetical protein C0J29_13195 [Mycobacterium paragordonae]